MFTTRLRSSIQAHFHPPHSLQLGSLRGVDTHLALLYSSYTHSNGQIKSAESSRKPESDLQTWQSQKQALKDKFGETGWQPRKRLSPDALEGIRHLHSQDPAHYSTPYLAEQFEVSPEVIRRILKSKWQPSDTEQADRRKRWEKRGQSVWDRWAELGMKAPRKWRDAKPQTNVDDSIMMKTNLESDQSDPSDGKRFRPRSSHNVPLSNRIL